MGDPGGGGADGRCRRRGARVAGAAGGSAGDRVYLNKVDMMDDRVVELVELELRELLNEYGFPGDETPVVRAAPASAGERQQGPECAGVRQHQGVVEGGGRVHPEPVRDVDKPFMMPVEDVFSIKGRGTVVTGEWIEGG